METMMNPGFPMSEDNIGIHGITNEQVAGFPPFQVYALDIYQFLQGCDLLGWNLINFDIPMLAEHFDREGIYLFPEPGTQVIDGKNIFMKKEPRSLAAAMQFYCKRNHDNAHNAGADVSATIDVLEAQIDYYGDLGNDVEALAAYSKMDERVDLAGKIAKDKDGDYIYNFSQNKGTKVKDNVDFAYWILERDFPSNTKKVLRQILTELESLSPEVGDDESYNYFFGDHN